MIRLHGYWRSGAAYRVRIALNLKGVAYEDAPHDLRTGEQRDAAYAALNPQRLVPALEVDGPDGTAVLTQSGAIMEWLEEAYPTPPLLPADAVARAVVRGMVGVVVCDIHPLGNLRVLDALRRDWNADGARVNAWAGGWIAEGFDALEVLVARHGGTYSFGDTPTLADCVVVPQVFSAARFHVAMDRWPRLAAAAAAAAQLPAVAAAHPFAQPGADPA